MSEIFISYAKQDRSRAKEVAARLEQEGWSVFWDRNIPIASTWDEVLENEISTMKVMVVLWSNASVASEWVRTEAEEGASRKILVPVILENVSLPLRFRALQAADISDWIGSQPDTSGMSQLVDAIARIGHFVTRDGVKADKTKHMAANERTGEEEHIHIGGDKKRDTEVEERLTMISGKKNFTQPNKLSKEDKFDESTENKKLIFKNKWVWLILGTVIIISIMILMQIINRDKQVPIQKINIQNSQTAEQHKNTGDDKFSRKNFTGAIVDYTKAIEMKPDYASAYSGRGLSYYNIAEYNKSLEDLNTAITMNINYFLAYDTRGRIYFERKEFDRAIADFTEAIRLNPKFAEAYDARAYSYWNKSENSLAISDFRKVIELSNDNVLRSRAEKNLKDLGVNP